jgi:hypothetical protein
LKSSHNFDIRFIALAWRVDGLNRSPEFAEEIG